MNPTDLNTQTPDGTGQLALRPGTLFAMAVWVGVVAGLLEAGLTIALRRFPVISPYHKVGEEVFVVAPAVNLLVMFVAALLLAGLNRFVRRVPQAISVLGGLVCIGAYTVLSYPRVISVTGVAALSVGLGVASARLTSRCLDAFLAFLRRTWEYALLATIAVGACALMSPALRERYLASQLPEAPPNAPNVLVIVVDTLRSDRLSAAGYARPTTPNLDRIAKESVFFENAFATAPWTLPSHNSLLTGRYTYEHRMDYPVPWLDHGFPYLQSVLQRNGYHTAVFTANNYSFSPEYVSEPFLHSDAHTFSSTAMRTSLGRKLAWEIERRFDVRLPPPRRAEEIRHNLLRWIDRSRRGPFFAVVNLFDVHEYRSWPPRAPHASRFGEVNPRSWRKLKGLPPKEEMDRAYDAAVTYVDEEIGRLFDELRRRGLDRNTLLVITSDHGEALGDHGEDGHTSNLYREQIQVPLILYYRGGILAGTRRREAVSLAWLPRTVVDLIGLPNVFPGRNLLAAQPGNEGETESPVLAEYHTLKGPKLVSLVTSRWQYVLNVRNSQEELFDLQQDPRELTNLAGLTEAERTMDSFRGKLGQLLPALRVSYGPNAFRTPLNSTRQQ